MTERLNALREAALKCQEIANGRPSPYTQAVMKMYQTEKLKMERGNEPQSIQG